MRTPTLCSGVTRAGAPCKFSARQASGLCINHDPGYAEQQRRNTEKGVSASVRSRRAQAALIDYEDFNLLTPARVQAFLDTVTRLELTGRLSPARARNLIRIGQLAVRNVNRTWIGKNDVRAYELNRIGLDIHLERLCREADERDAERE